MKNYFRVYKQNWVELSTDEKVTYAVISGTTDFNTSCTLVTYEKISELSGIKSLPCISKHIKVLEDKFFLRKEDLVIRHRRRHSYHILDKGHYEKISRDILKAGLSKGELALYISLALLKYRDTNEVDIINVYEHCGISKPTYYKYLRTLRDKGLLTFKNGVVTLLKYIDTEKKFNRKTSEFINSVITNYPKSSAKYKQVSWLNKNEWKGVKDVDSYVKSIEAGVPLHRKTLNQLKYPKI